MLKRFLQLFRNEEASAAEVDHPHFDELEDGGSGDTTYLDFLFSSVRPRVKERISEHPTTDPILEIATRVLLEVFPDYWEEADGPLRDQWSPQTEAAPPPPPQSTDAQGPPAPPGATDSEENEGETEKTDETQAPGQEEANVTADDEIEEGDETATAEDELSEARADDDESKQEETDEEATQSGDLEDIADEVAQDEGEDVGESGESGEDVDESGEEVGEDVDKIYDTDALEAIEEHSADADAAPPAGFVSSLNDTAEFEPPPVLRGAEEESIWPVAVDTPSILRGARVLLAVLIDNDRLPVDAQLEVNELLVAADLWVHLMAQATDLDERAQNLARQVEKKFETNHFSQARLLLELFPANFSTRIKHDRQLFYEDMILRLGVRHVDEADTLDDLDLDRNLRSLNLDEDDELCRRFEELAEEAGLRMHVYTREPSQVEKWRDVAETCPWPDAAPYILGKLPPRRWREIKTSRERRVKTSLREHIVLPMARDHVITHIKACYFVLRAVGDTGLEPYLDCFFDWSESVCDVKATTYLSQLHRRVQGNQEMIDDVFADIYDEHYRTPVAEALEALDDEVLASSFGQAMEHLASANFTEVAGGNFNLGAFVLDAFLGIEHPNSEFSFKLHRLT